MARYYSSFSTEPSIDASRLAPVVTILIITMFTFAIRLWYLQIMQGDKFYQIAQKNHIRKVRVPAPRGIIYDRNKTPILSNRPNYNLVFIPQYSTSKKHTDYTLSLLSELLKIPKENFLRRVQKARHMPRFHPVKLLSNLTMTQVDLIEVIKTELFGVDIQVEPSRDYNRYTPIHLVGYLREINNEEIKKLNQISLKRYRLGDYIGKLGLEKLYETYLRGIEGAQYYKVDAYGRKIQAQPLNFEQFSTIRQIPGNNLILTLDYGLQKAAKDAFESHNGVVIAIKPTTGEILAFLSHPNFDPHLYEDGLTPKEWKSLSENLHRPLLDKTTAGSYPPGSTWKPFVALAALEEGFIDKETTWNCPGHFTLGRGHYNCWRKGGHQHVELIKSMRESCDVYYYNIGSKMDIDVLSSYAELFGFGKRTGLKLNTERSGISPTRKWKKDTFKIPWVPGDTISISIGQGYNSVTPIQLAMAYGALATNGELYRPYVVKQITDAEQNIILENKPILERSINIKDEFFEMVKDGLCEVVSHPKGTGKASRVKGVEVCGKTGTAQTASLSKSKFQDDVSFHYRDHAWFTAFAPRENPEIVVLVLSEYSGGHGGSTAAPVAKKILQYYFDRKKNDLSMNSSSTNF